MSKVILRVCSILSIRSITSLRSCLALQNPPLLNLPSSGSQKEILLTKASLVRLTLIPISESSATAIVPNSDDLSYPSTYTKPDGTRRGFSNWLIRDRVMIGQYPGQTPEEGGPSPREVRKYICSLVDDDDYDGCGNVRLFCSLQSEIPPQNDKKTWNRERGKIYLPPSRGNEDFPHFFGHYQPIVRAALLERKDGVKQQAVGEDGLGGGGEPRYLHAPILDLDTPDAPSLYKLLAELLDTMLLQYLTPQSQQEKYSAIYIHCWGGRGRAGLVGACLLSVLYPEISADMCLEWVQRGYNTRKGAEMMPVGLRRSPQTEGQRDFVRAFVEDVRR